MNKEDLLEALQAAKPALAQQGFIPSLTHFMLDKDSILANNGIMAIRTYLDTGLACGLPGDILLKLLGSMSVKDVVLEQTVEHEVLVRGGRTKMKLPYLSLEDSVFEEFEDDAAALVIVVDSKFINAVSRCLISIGVEHGSPSESGITVSIDSNGKGTLYATDNRTISKHGIMVEVLEGSKGIDLILSKEFCVNLISLANTYGDDAIDLCLSTGYAKAYFSEDAELLTKISPPEDDCYDFEEILENFVPGHKGNLPAQPVSEDIEAILSRSLVLLSNEKDKEFRVTVKGTVVDFFTKSEYGEVKDSLKFKTDMGEMTFMLDPSLLQRALTETSKILFLERAVVCIEGKFLHVISHNHLEGHGG